MIAGIVRSPASSVALKFWKGGVDKTWIWKWGQCCRRDRTLLFIVKIVAWLCVMMDYLMYLFINLFSSIFFLYFLYRMIEKSHTPY
jgi:hypothetical protein